MMENVLSLHVKFIHPGKARGVLFKPFLTQGKSQIDDRKNSRELFEEVLKKVRAKIALKNSDISEVLLLMTHDPSFILSMTRGIDEGKSLKTSIEEGIADLRMKRYL